MIRKFGSVSGITEQPPGLLVGQGSGNAQPADVLAGKTYTNDVGQKVGTMVDRSGDTAALSSTVSGTTLKLRASDGYRDGTNDFVTITDSDFVAGNILTGINMFGLAGSLKPQLYASGILLSSSGTELYKSGTSSYMVTSDPLGFVPKFVLISTSLSGTNNYATIFYWGQLAYEGGDFTTNSLMFNTNLSSSTISMFMTTTPSYSGGYVPYCNSTGFKLPVKTGSELYYYYAVGWN